MSGFRQGWLPFIEQALRRQFATAAQGLLAATAVQPADLTGYATAAQGAKADTAVQPAALLNYSPLYQRVAPRSLQWDNVAVSTAGQNYFLSSIPGEGTFLVHCSINPGYGGPPGISIVFADPSDEVKPVPSADLFTGSRIADATGFTNGSTYNIAATTHIWIPVRDGQVWAQRAGSYAGASAQSVLYILGFVKV